MIRWSASASDRVVRCPASLSLPAVVEPAGPEAAWGTAVHAFLEDAVRTCPADARGRVEGPAAACCRAIAVHGLLEELAGGDAILALHTEDPCLYAPDTGVAEPLYLASPRAYTARDYERGIPGTADLVLVTSDGTVVVADYKTGAHPPRAADSWQLLVLGLAAARLYGAARVRVAIVAIDREGGYRIDAVDLDAAAQAIARTTLAEAWAAAHRAEDAVLLGETPSVTTGDHCAYCPALRSCPASTALVREMAAGGLEGVAEAVAGLAPSAAGAAWVNARRARGLLDLVERALRDRLRLDGSLPLPGGDTLVTSAVRTRSIDGRRALPLLAARGLDPRVTISLEAVDEAVTSSGGGHGELAEVMIALVEAGAVTTATSERTRVIKANADKRKKSA